MKELSIYILLTVILLGIYVHKLRTGRNIIAGLSDLMKSAVKEDWIDGIAEGIKAIEGS